MSGLLDALSRDASRRIRVRRRMMDHLGLAPTDAECLSLRGELRETLLACSRCPDPAICEGWIDQARPGLPMFCRARESFLRLEAALAVPEPLRRTA